MTQNGNQQKSRHLSSNLATNGTAIQAQTNYSSNQIIRLTWQLKRMKTQRMNSEKNGSNITAYQRYKPSLSETGQTKPAA